MSVKAENVSIDDDEPVEPLVITDRMKDLMRQPMDGLSFEAESEEETADSEPDAESESEPEVDAEPEQEAAESDDWITDELKTRAASYGINESELADFESAADFDKAARRIDRFATKLLSDPSPAEPAEPAKEPEKDESDDDEYVDAPRDKKGRINVEFFRRNDYNDETIALAETARAQADAMAELQGGLNSIRAAQAEVEQQRVWNAVHEAIDAIGSDELFGKSIVDGNAAPLKPELHKNRDAVYRVMHSMNESMKDAGQEPLSINDAARRAAIILYGEKILSASGSSSADAKKAQREKLVAQSKRVRPVAGSTSAKTSYKNAPPADPTSTEAILKSPEITSMLKRFREENGEL